MQTKSIYTFVNCLRLFTFVAILNLSINVGIAQTWSSNPSINTYAACGSGTISCSFGNVLGGSTIKARVTSLTSTSVTIQVTKCSGTFSSGGTMYVKNAICNTNAYASNTYVSLSSSVSVTFSHGVLPGQSVTFYPTITSTTNDKFHAAPITISATATPCNVPNSSSFSTSSISNNSFIASWPSVSGAISYDLNYTLWSDVTYSNATLISNISSTSYTLPNLVCGEQYRFQVRAKCGSNYSLWSGSISSPVQLLTCAIPNPATFSASSITPTSFAANWTAVSGATSYEVNYTTCSGTYTIPALSTSTNSILINGLTSATSYKFQVRAKCGSTCYSLWSGSSTCVTTSSCTVPNSSGFSSTNITNTSFTASWLPVSGANSYDLNYTLWSDVNYSNATLISNLSSTSYAALNLICGEQYRFQVRAKCGSSYSLWSGSISSPVQLSTCAIPNPTTFYASNVTPTSFVANWAAVSGATSYEVNYTTCSGTYTIPTLSTSTNSILVNGLTSATSYKFQVRAKCGSTCYSLWSGSSSCITTTAPQLCLFSAINATSFIQTQTNIRSVVYKNQGTGPWTGSLVMRMYKQGSNDSADIALSGLITIPAGSTYTLTGTSNKIKSNVGTYTIKLWRQEGSNWLKGISCGPFADSLVIQIVDPFQPNQFFVTDISTTTAKLHWTFKPSVDKAKILNYSGNIQECSLPNYPSTPALTNITDTFATISNLLPATSYKFQLQGVYINDQGVLDSTNWSGSIQTTAGNINCFTTSALTSPNLVASTATISPIPLIQNQPGSISNIITNVGTGNFTGYVYLSIQNTIGGPPIDLNLNAGTLINIAAGSSLTLAPPPGNILSAPGNYLIETKYALNPNGPYITINSTPIAIQLANSCGGCTAWTNPPAAGSVACIATSYLCSNNIIIPNQDGADNAANAMLRRDLAAMLYNALFNGAGSISDYFPQAYRDLTDKNAYYYKPALALSYLRYANFETPFQRDNDFDPDLPIARKYALKVFLEAWNILPDSTGYDENDNTASSFACDVMKNHEMYDYLKKAKTLNILTGYTSPYCSCGGTCLNPDGNITREEAFIILYRLKTLSTIAQPQIDSTSFYWPHNLTIENIRESIGKEKGGFKEYGEAGFNINGQVPLRFSIWYDATKSGDDISGYFIKNRADTIRYNFESLGSGWTHNYNSYIIIKKGNENASFADDNLIIRYSDGDFAVFDYLTATSFTPKTKGIYEQLIWNGSEFQLKFKNQIIYHYGYIGTNYTRAVLTAITDRFGNSINLSWNTPSASLNGGYPRLSTVQDPYGRYLQFEYGLWHRPFLITKVNCIAGSITRSVEMTYKNLFTELGTFKNANNKITSYDYFNDEQRKHLLRIVHKPKGNKLYCDFDGNRKLNRLSNTSFTGLTDGKEFIAVAYQYTNNQPQTLVTSSFLPDIGASTQAHIQKVLYNEIGRPISVHAPNNAINDTIEYNDLANPTLPTKIKNLLTNVTNTYVYDNSLSPKRGNLLSASLQGGSMNIMTSQTYTSLNDIDTYTDQEGIVTYNTYNNGALTSTLRNGIVTTITPNTNGTIAQINRGGITVQFGQNSYGNTNSMNVVGTSISASTLYDDASRPYQRTAINGRIDKVTTYDNVDNIVDLIEDYGGMQLLLHNSYDDNNNQIDQTSEGQTIIWEYDPVTDNLINETFGNYHNQWTFHLNGKLNTFKNKNNYSFIQSYFPQGTFKYGLLASDGYASYDYHATNHSLQTITKNSKTLSLGFDALQRPISCTYTDGIPNNTISHSLNKYGSIITTNYPNGPVVTTVRNANNQITETKVNGITIHQRNYDFSNGRELSQEWGGGLINCTNTYQLNSGYLNARDYVNSGGVPLYFEHYLNIDAAGNHEKENIMPLPNLATPLPNYSILNFTPNAINQAINDTNGANMGYNNNGVQLTGALIATADERDNITSISKGTYTSTMDYDGLEVRRRKGSSRYVVDVLDENKVLEETDLNGNPLWFMIWSGNEIVCRINAQSGQKYYPIKSYNGSVRMWINDAGTITHQYYYDADGNVLSKQEDFPQPYQFNGVYGIQTDAPDILYMQARYYRPSQRRFISADPIHATNAYVFAANNPVMNVDPSGEIVPFIYGAVITAMEAYSWANVIADQGAAIYFYNKASTSDDAFLINEYQKLGDEYQAKAISGGATNLLTFGVGKAISTVAKKIPVAVEVTKSLKKVYTKSNVGGKTILNVMNGNRKLINEVMGETISENLIQNPLESYLFQYFQNQSNKSSLNYFTNSNGGANGAGQVLYPIQIK